MRNFALFLVMLFTVVGCSNANESGSKTNTGTKEIEPVAVDLAIYPSPIEVNQEVTFEATITQGDEKVDDASDVEFEWWKNGDEKHTKIKADHQGNGIYSIKQTFSETGSYNVISHVTARDMHTMPQRQFEVVDLNNKNGAQPEADAHMDHHHEGTDLMIHFMTDEQINKNVETQLEAHITYKEAPLQGARVRFEVWKDGAEKHQYIDATEGNEGEYTAKETFSEAGSYNIKIHVEEKTNEIHDHKVEKVTIH
ncbi:FixH family protein [Schinkia sp. CFF1]